MSKANVDCDDLT